MNIADSVPNWFFVLDNLQGKIHTRGSTYIKTCMY